MAIVGSQKLAVFLCKFSDTERVEPQKQAYYIDLFSKRGTGGLNDYWTAATLGAVNLDGTEVFGWKTIGITRDDFVTAHPGRWDKIKGAVDAFSDVDMSKFVAAVAIFNVDVGDAGAQGGVLAGPGDTNATFLAHEIGHVFGLEHSFDTSTRKAISWSGEGEYFDSYDVMSAMNVASDGMHRFSPRGPLLNAANMKRMGWLPANRVWQPMGGNSSASYYVDLVALENPEIPGFLAADLGLVIVEFRIPQGFDAGLPRPAVLIHRPAEPNSVIVASDPVNFIDEWQPGQVYTAIPGIFGQSPVISITIISFNVQAKTAKLMIGIKAARAPLFNQIPMYILGPDNSLVTLIDGKIIRVPIPDPRLVEFLTERNGIGLNSFTAPTVITVPREDRRLV